MRVLSSLPYHDPLIFDDCVVSVDNIRIRFTYSSKLYDFEFKRTYDTLWHIQKRLSMGDINGVSPGDITWSICTGWRIGAYACTGRVAVKRDGVDSAFALLIGRYAFTAARKKMADEIILDVNPNKVPWDVIAWYYRFLSADAKEVDVVRYDVAFDYPISRLDTFLVQDHTRSYRLYRDGDGVTEYQGVRHSNGAVKVYDKTTESGLDHDVTRVEVTIDGDYENSVSTLYPKVHTYISGQLGLDLPYQSFIVRACLLYPDLIEVLKSTVSRNTFKDKLSTIRAFDKKPLVPGDWSLVDSYLRTYLSRFRSGNL